VSRDQQCARGTISVVAAGFLATGLIIQSLSGKAAADPGDYNFTVLARIPGPAPGGGRFDLDFEPYAINGNGSAAFVADLKVANQDIGEGVFVSRQGQLLQIARAGQPAPGGGTFDGGALGHTPLNDAGSGAFVYILEVEPPPAPDAHRVECWPLPIFPSKPNPDRRCRPWRYHGAHGWNV